MYYKIERLIPLIFLILFLNGCESKEEKHCKKFMKQKNVLEKYGQSIFDMEMEHCLEYPGKYKTYDLKGN